MTATTDTFLIDVFEKKLLIKNTLIIHVKSSRIN